LKHTKKEKDILDQILDTIEFKGLTQDEVAGQGRLIRWGDLYLPKPLSISSSPRPAKSRTSAVFSFFIVQKRRESYA